MVSGEELWSQKTCEFLTSVANVPLCYVVSLTFRLFGTKMEMEYCQSVTQNGKVLLVELEELNCDFISRVKSLKGKLRVDNKPYL